MRLKEGDHHPSAGVPPPVTEEPSRHAASLDPLAALSPARGTARRERWDLALAGAETELASLQSHIYIVDGVMENIYTYQSKKYIE